MGDYVLVSPDGVHRIALAYAGEPPHGDSYHRAVIDGRAFPRYVWGCLFAFSSCSRYLVLSWMPARFERRTAVVDLRDQCFLVLPEYIYQFCVRWPAVVGDGKLSAGKQYTFHGNELWHPY